MSSIIEGYSYDIFLSYRQKDNKGERWVSEFVEALKTELEATFKEDISIYFDENPHDGLLETHDVDASLKEKLNCLIFIPIISRTYCDPKAFAWEHEFLAFIKQASSDKFGMKVTLPNGNVATRVLPVRIHELGLEDTRLCETALGGVLRGVDFIYKAPGVNRPLRMNEDHPRNNLNRTNYRDQINKVANAVNDIVLSLKILKPGRASKSLLNDKKEISKVNKLKFQLKSSFSPLKLRKSAVILISVLICLFAFIVIYNKIPLTGKENTIAFIRLQNSADDSSLVNASSEFIESIYQKLMLVKSISVIPEFLTDQYDESEKSLRMIRRELKANYILYGKIRRENREIKIGIELSTTKDNKVLWNKTYTWNNNLVSKNISDMVRIIASNMQIILTEEEKKKIDAELSDNPDMNMKIITANKDLQDAWYYYNYGDKFLDSSSFKTAIESYNSILKEDSLSASAYAKRAIARSWGYFLGELDSTHIQMCREDIEKALSIDRDLSEIDIAWGFYYYYCLEKNDEALEFFEKASRKDPGNYKPIFYMALVNRRLGNWDACRKNIRQVIRFNVQEALFLTNIGMTYTFFHEYDSALIYQQKAIDLIPGWMAGYKNKFDALILKNGVTSEVRSLIDETFEKTGDNMMEYRIQLKMFDRKYSEALQLALKSDPGDFDQPAEKELYLARLSMIMNNPDSASKHYNSALSELSGLLNSYPDESALHAMLGLAYAGLGQKTKAIEEGKLSVQIAHKKNRMDENEMKIYLAQVYTMLGDYENAFPGVLFLLNNPSFFSKKLLRIDPVWQPLLDHPDYRKRIK